MRITLTVFLLLLLRAFCCLGDSVYIINEAQQEFESVGKESLFLDPENRFTIQNVQAQKFQAIDKNNEYLNLDKHQYNTYWVKFTIKWEIPQASMLVTPLPARLIELYVPDENGGFTKFTSGVKTPFHDKKFKTNTHTFTLNQASLGKSVTYYLKVTSYAEFIPFLIVTDSHFVNHTVLEYFLQGIMLGIVFVAGFYNLILFLKLKETSYLFYSLYVVCFGVFGMLIWHYHYNFLWFTDVKISEINYIYNVFYFLITTFFLFYAKNFFYVKNKGSKLDQVFRYLIALRIITFALGLTIAPIFRNAWTDTIILFPVFFVAYYSYKKRFLPAKNFFYAFSVLYFGMFVHGLAHNLDRFHPYFHQTNIFFMSGCAGMFLFSLSLGERMQILVEEKDRTKNELINQLKDNEAMKDNLNQDLEQKIKERTNEIQERNKQLDTFVYRASHDIKGPLKSILGLGKLGMLESNDEITKAYFNHICKSSRKLDATLTDLLNVVKMNHAKIEKHAIDFNCMLEEILSSFQHSPNYSAVHFILDVQEGLSFHTDSRLLYSVFQNLIENAINYCDLQKAHKYLKISVHQEGDMLNVVFEDNGIGIAEEYEDKIFEMFFKIDTHSTGTGLGMYLVKQTLERIDGTISMESALGVGTNFYLTFKNDQRRS